MSHTRLVELWDRCLDVFDKQGNKHLYIDYCSPDPPFGPFYMKGVVRDLIGYKSGPYQEVCAIIGDLFPGEALFDTVKLPVKWATDPVPDLEDYVEVTLPRVPVYDPRPGFIERYCVEEITIALRDKEGVTATALEDCTCIPSELVTAVAKRRNGLTEYKGLYYLMSV